MLYAGCDCGDDIECRLKSEVPLAERAHPDDPAFQERWTLHLLKGWFPWPKRTRNQYRRAMLWRYEWANQYARGKRVLEIPCGMGWGTSLIRSSRHLVGVDICPTAVAEARQRYGSRIHFQVGNMAHLEFHDASFDLVCCLEGIEHVSAEIGESFLKESWRVLAPGGTLMLTSPYCHTLQHSGNPYHLHEYLPEEICKRVQEKFEISEMFERSVDIMNIVFIRATRRDR